MVRFVFGSNLENPSDTKLDGFALDDFKLSSRNRKVLVENYTSASKTANNNAYNQFKLAVPPNEELVKLQYHTSLQESDPINLQNPADPNARVGYYGLTNSSESIPRAVIDGQTLGNFLTLKDGSPWIDGSFADRTLIDSPFEITILTDPSDEPGELNVTTTIKALTDVILTAPELVHYITVVEKEVDSGIGGPEYVVRKMLPSAAGTILPRKLPKDTVVTISAKWLVSNENIDPSDLAIVAFVQHQETKEVFQAEVEYTPTNLPSTVTGVEELFEKKIKLFPNPAKDEVHIILPGQAPEQIPVTIFDQFGRKINTSGFDKGEYVKNISVKDFAAGVYIIELATSKGMIRKKLMVIHD
jgi:hypothetical protein